MILTDDAGRDYTRPMRADYASDVEYVCAFHAWRDRIANAANEAFDRAFRGAMLREAGRTAGRAAKRLNKKVAKAV